MSDLTPINEFEKEIAKSFGKEAAKNVLGFIKSIINPPAEELGELLRDTVRYYRFKNQIKILAKAEEHVRRSGIKPHPIKLKMLTTALEFGSLEEDDYMQDKWSALLANVATSSSSRINIDSSIIEILKQLSPNEAKVLDILYRHYHSYHDISQDLGRTLGKNAFDGLFYDDVDFLLMVDNLKRQNLVATKDKWEINLTTLGFKFVEKCTPFYIRIK